MFDIVIRNGRVIDGTGNPWTKQDIGIENGRIAVLGNMPENVEANRVIDATNLVVTPGFIDPHVHSDLMCLVPSVHQVKVMQGVTTELLGQDGLSAPPVSPKTKPLWRRHLQSLDGDIGEWPWNTVADFLRHLSKASLNGNVAYLVPHGAVRTLIVGFEGRVATSDETRKMRFLVEEAMEQGAVGLSSGLVYPPNLYSDTDELVEICKGAAKYNGCFAVHMRNESSHILAALDEMIEVSRRSGVRLHISHFKVVGQANRHYYEAALEKIHRARHDGLEVTFDQYPYAAGSTMFHSTLPPWMHDGGIERLVKRLEDASIQEEIRESWKTDDSYENWVLHCGWKNIVITSVSSEQNRMIEGLNLDQIAKLRGKTPEDAAFELLLQERGNVTMLVHWGFEEDIISAMQSPLQMVGSDSIFGGTPHPRLYGTYPRVLSRFVRETGALRLEDAVRRMTGAPAQLWRMKDRGLLRETYSADVVILNPETIRDTATYEQPTNQCTGVESVIVNGQLVVDSGIHTGNFAGQVIYRHK